MEIWNMKEEAVEEEGAPLSTLQPEELKGKPLSRVETIALLELVESSKVIITKKTNASTNKMKNQEWERIARVINSTTTTRSRRTPKQLRLKWENLKKLARKRTSKIMKTGGGVDDYIPPDDILDRVSSFLGSTATGFDDLNGGDVVPQTSSGSGGSIGDGGDGGSDEEGAGVLGGRAEVCEVLEPADMALPASCSNAFPSPPLKRKKFSPMFTGKKKMVTKLEDARKASDHAVANYYTTKKECLVETHQLQKYKLQLENKKLELEIEKLQLELDNRNRQLQVEYVLKAEP